ncbi:SDR family oxidoreductase [Pusillimonas sp. TS35]|uniref:SDR family NAD(P)-dependent oxidoreductase n=1 Tax=Paracandidimonas lactea TaxID=2895524 RepID=UPI00136BDA23|nr:SDR family NAD(P)-dependent oxidoreductase [Paracandidimonas lactea]MYN12365.1 SDR family oxidoreductase [Pusillimonas sp. TS35]
MKQEEWSGRTIAITGAGGGIGHACAQQLDRHGVRLVLVDRNEAALKSVVGSLQGTKHEVRCSDLDSPEKCAQALACDGPLYGLIHMAGIYEQDDLGEQYRSVWDRTLKVNLDMVFDLVSAAISQMSGPGQGRLVLAASVAYRRGSWDHLAYSASKGGVAAMVRALSRKMAPGVLVNGVAPGIIDTGMPAQVIASRGDSLRREIPLQRWGTAEEVANVAIFLCSDASSYITGQIINVDGGMVNS